MLRETYGRARRARQGSETLDPIFDGLVQDFRAAYGIAPLWIDASVGWEGGMKDKPCLDVVIERNADLHRIAYRTRTEEDPRRRPEDPKDVITRMVLSRFSAAGLRQVFSLPDRIDCDWSRDIRVTLSGFEQETLANIPGSMTPADKATFASSLGLGEALWMVWPIARTVVVFVHTQEQALHLARPVVLHAWADSYLQLARKYDEFGYIRPGWMDVRIDSKESFDRDWGGDFYAYMK